MTKELLLLLGGIALGSYLLGSFNFAVILSRALYREDIRTHGSGNAGMTNMLRTYGKKAGALTAVGDFGKTTVAVLISRWLFTTFGVDFPLDVGYISGLFVFLGHIFPVYFGFRGGKGVVTTLGIMLCVNPIAFLIIVMVFVPLVFITRIVSLSSVLGAIAYPVITWAFSNFRDREPLYDTLFAAAFSVMVLILHRDNIKRLLSGTESRFEKKK